MNQFRINIGLFGCVSVGKSTFLNAIVGRQYSDTEIKKTTMVPQIYIENDENPTNASIIRYKNRTTNEEISKIIDMNQFRYEKCQPIYHQMDRICDLFDSTIIDPRIKITIHDIPGLNDSASKNIYFEWVRQNIKIFDIIIFVTDITKGLNNADETDVLKLLLDSMTKSKAIMICLINKCDDIYFDKEQDDLIFEENEQENIYIQANNILLDIAKTYGFAFSDKNNRFTPFIPISSENCFIYRALMRDPRCELDAVHKNRLCKNECGANQWKKMNSDEKEILFQQVLTNLASTYDTKIQDTGYLSVKTIIQNTIINHKEDFIMNHMENELKNLACPVIDNMPNYIKSIIKYNEEMTNIETIIGEISYEPFWKNIKNSITCYVDNIIKINSKIIQGRDFIDIKEFDTLHCLMQSHCLNFNGLMDATLPIKQYPTDFMGAKKNQIINKLLSIYDQLSLIEPGPQLHILPTNLHFYLKIINIYAPMHFDTYAHKFLGFFCNNIKIKHIMLQEDELANLIEYIGSLTTLFPTFIQLVCNIIINKQVHLQTANKNIEPYVHYLIRTKRLINQTMDLLSNEEYYPLGILYEIVEKNISLLLESSSVTNMYRRELDCHRVCTLLTTQISEKNMLSINLEQRAMRVISSKSKKN